MERYEMEQWQSVKQYTVWQALADREVLKLCVIYFLWITGFWGFNYWMPTVLKEVSGWSNMEIGVLIVIPMLLSLIAMVYTGSSSARTGEKRWHGAVPMFIGAAEWRWRVYYKSSRQFRIRMSCRNRRFRRVLWWSYPTTFLSERQRRVL